MNASTTFDTAKAIADKLTEHEGAAGVLAEAFPGDRKADVCRLLAEAMRDKEKGTRQGISVSTTITKALDGAKNFSDLEIASLKAFWQLAVVADSVVNAK